MAVKQVYFSEAGAAAEAYAKANNIALKFARFGIGTGENATPENCEVKDERYTVPIQMVKNMGAGIFKIRGVFSNENLTADFEYRELALYIENPETPGAELLYCYGNAKTTDGDYTEIIPAFSGSGNKISRMFDIDVRVSSGSATFIIDDNAKADVATTAELREDLEQEITDRKNAIIDIEHGGTGATTDREANYNLLNNLQEETDPTDNTEIVAHYETGTKTKGAIHKMKLGAIFNYIKEKIASTLGLTAENYNGKAAAATNDGNGNNIAETYATKGELGTVESEAWGITKTNIAADLGLTAGEYNGNSRTANKLHAFTASGGGGHFVKAVRDDEGWNTHLYMNYIDDSAAGGDQNNVFVRGADIAEFAYRAGVNTVYACSTAAETAEKAVTVTGFKLEVGACIRVCFSKGNNIENPTLNVSNTGAKQILLKNISGSKKYIASPYGTGNSGAYKWDSGACLDLRFDGTYWIVLGNPLIAYGYSANVKYERYIHGGGFYERTVTISSSTGISGGYTNPIDDIEIEDDDLVEKLRNANRIVTEVNEYPGSTSSVKLAYVGADNIIYLYDYKTGKIYNATYKARFFF
jgi:hypothetical protein